MCSCLTNLCQDFYNLKLYKTEFGGPLSIRFFSSACEKRAAYMKDL